MVGIGRHLEVTLNAALDCLAPRLCARCRGEGAALCIACESAWVPRPPLAACPACTKDAAGSLCEVCKPSWALDGLLAIDAYADPVMRRLIQAWKYGGDPAVWDALRTLVHNISVPTLAFDAVTWAPLHAARRRGRGFDQAEDLARELADVLDLPVFDGLTRAVRTRQRAKMAHTDRKKGDIANAFICQTPAPGRILLCDDVFTSGATMDAAAQALKAAGAREVWGFALARG